MLHRWCNVWKRELGPHNLPNEPHVRVWSADFRQQRQPQNCTHSRVAGGVLAQLATRARQCRREAAAAARCPPPVAACNATHARATRGRAWRDATRSLPIIIHSRLPCSLRVPLQSCTLEAPVEQSCGQLAARAMVSVRRASTSMRACARSGGHCSDLLFRRSSSHPSSDQTDSGELRVIVWSWHGPSQKAPLSMSECTSLWLARRQTSDSLPGSRGARRHDDISASSWHRVDIRVLA